MVKIWKLQEDGKFPTARVASSSMVRYHCGLVAEGGELMEWARILACITDTVDQELVLRNEYLAAENRILRAPPAAERWAFTCVESISACLWIVHCRPTPGTGFPRCRAEPADKAVIDRHWRAIFSRAVTPAGNRFSTHGRSR